MFAKHGFESGGIGVIEEKPLSRKPEAKNEADDHRQFMSIDSGSDRSLFSGSS